MTLKQSESRVAKSDATSFVSSVCLHVLVPSPKDVEIHHISFSENVNFANSVHLHIKFLALHSLHYSFFFLEKCQAALLFSILCKFLFETLFSRPSVEFFPPTHTVFCLT